jgi:murein tripeptide amidase MpaA
MVYLAFCTAYTISLSQDSVWDEVVPEQEKRSYEGHALVQFQLSIPKDRIAFQHAVLRHNLDVWEHGQAQVVARVPPSVDLSEIGIDHRVLTENLEASLLQEAQAAGAGFHERYHSSEEVEAFAQQLVKQHPKTVRIERIGTTFENRPISVLHVSSAGPKKEQAPVVFVQAGQHAREWIAPAAAMSAVEAAAKTAEARGGLSGFQLSMILLVNPDGYQYTHDKDRMWRKNRNPKSSPKPKRKPFQSEMVYKASLKGTGNCQGVDLNRNWGTHWGQTIKNGKLSKESGGDGCSNEYHGESAMSEPEVQAVSKHIQSQGKRIAAFLDIHSYSQKMLPPGCNGFPITEADKAEQLRTAQAVVNAMGKAPGSVKYETGPCAEEMYTCAGTAPDWAFHEAGILHSYCIELRPTMKDGAGHWGGNGFVVPPSNIQATGKELLAGIYELASQALSHTGSE